VLTGNEHCAPPRHAKHQPQGEKVAILDPEVVLTDALEYLRNQAALLSMAVLTQHHLGNHQRLAREGGGPGAAQFLEAMLGRG
jgi:hypothetical protein